MLTKGWYRAVLGYFAIYKRAGCKKPHRSGRRIDLDIPGLWVMYEIVDCADLAASDPGFRQQIRKGVSGMMCKNVLDYRAQSVAVFHTIRVAVKSRIRDEAWRY